ncbi:MAG: hypothetical protein GY732_03280 [Gammaproteobacteria bacterium]|nr:hypothetical protein [Gammaproteobacteria bacterium]
MEDRKKTAVPKRPAPIDKSRAQFRVLIASNPNYFGNLADTKFKAVKKIVASTSFEELTELGYNPNIKQLSATFDLKKAVGYGGDLCDEGTQEYVRFYVDLGSGWEDAGLAGTGVHDIPLGKDCANKNSHPLSYSVETPYSPKRRWCTSPQLPKARAILSWNIQPPAGQPNWKPVYGNVLECSIQIDKGLDFGIFVDELKAVKDLPLELVESIKYPIEMEPGPPEPIPGPDPAPINSPFALSLDELAQHYQHDESRKLQVEPHRFAFSAYQEIKLSTDSCPGALTLLTTSLAKFDIDIGKLVTSIENTKGNISYEELEDLGLDWNQEKLVATYRVKKPSGFSGGLCSKGSTEYVSFWVDWGNKCKWKYLDTVEVKSYDFSQLPDGGLCYTAVLPVDLSRVRRGCNKPKIGRVRAVLSWNTPPSKVDPSKVPHWGNRLDAHVLIPPGEVYQGVQPILTVVGGIGVPYIDNFTGLTTPTAKFVDNGLKADSLGRPCPFGGRIVVRGPGFPGHRYRVQVRELGTAVWSTLVKKLWVTTSMGFGSYHTIDADGWFKYLGYSQNFAGILAYFDTSGNAKWDIRLQIEAVSGFASQTVQLDNTWPSLDVSITDPVGDCGLLMPGATMKGKAVATDSYMGSWSVVIDGGPSGFGPVATDTGAGGTSNTPAGGSEWTFNTSGLVQCGYVVRVHARDRAIVNSVGNNHHRSTDVGFCVIED